MGVYSQYKPENSARKNPFDLSCFTTYNTKVGLMIPLKFFPTLPSSEYELDLKCLLRTQPLATAAFAGFSVNYDVVWTPNNDHYSSFNQYIAQRLNKQHTTQPDIQEIPHFDLGKFQKVILAGAVIDSFAGEVSLDQIQWLHDNQDYQITTFRFLAHSVHLPEESMFVSAIRTLDMLEYGNLLPFLKYYKNSIKTFLDSFEYTRTEDESLPYFIKLLAYFDGKFTTEDGVSTFDSLQEFMPEKDMNGYVYASYDFIFENFPYYSMKFKFDENKFYSLWPVFCYNKAFWQFYRNEYYDIDYEFIIADTDGSTELLHFDYVQLFNYDDYSSALEPAPDDQDTYIRLLSMFAVKPHQYKKDLFTGILPSTQYGSVSVAFTDNDVDRNLLVPVYQQYKEQDSITGEWNNKLVISPSSSRVMFKDLNKVSGRVADVKFDPALSISALELRKVDAMQRFRERMLRAGNKTKDIFVAHGWDEPLSEKAFDVQFFGNFDGRLDLNVVASTTDSENVNLGQLAANGIAIVNGSKVHFKCKDFGTLLVIAYITKDAVYDSYGVHKSHSMLEPFDFPYPELQNISLAPIVESQLNCFGSNKPLSVLGYEPQNMAYKTQNDLVHGEFFSTAFVDSSESAMPNFPAFIGKFANMVTPRQDILNCKSLSFLYVQPSCADNIFVESANCNQDTDQIFGNVRLELKAVQPLDVIGLPI